MHTRIKWNGLTAKKIRFVIDQQFIYTSKTFTFQTNEMHSKATCSCLSTLTTLKFCHSYKKYYLLLQVDMPSLERQNLTLYGFTSLKDYSLFSMDTVSILQLILYCCNERKRRQLQSHIPRTTKVQYTMHNHTLSHTPSTPSTILLINVTSGKNLFYKMDICW